MRLSKTCVQASLAMAFLADCPPHQPVQARHVARFLGVPPDSALKILQALVRQNLLASHLGRGGGYCLHRPAGEISLLQIFEAIDGPIDGHLRLLDAPMDAAPVLMVLKTACDEAAASLRQSLAGVTVADLQRSVRVTPQPVNS